MILTETKRPVTSTMTGESRQFTIKTNRKAFQVLVDGIYSDKPGAITRELMSNAHDAHIRRKATDVPFEVRLPNALNPTFSVRDYGCSMTHDEIMGLYSTLFESSKSTSNDETGAFGLGAKSFLAYTDACTVNCWLDGEHRAYMVALDEDGIPAVTLVNREPSTAPQGVEVTFAVQAQDFHDFQQAVSRAALGYDMLPRVVGGELTIPKPKFTGPGYRMYHGQIASRNTHMVRQGSAVYPCDVDTWNLGIPYGYHLIVDVAIGEADVTSSREMLALTPSQRSNIQGKFRAAVQHMNGQVQAQYKALTTDLEKAWFAYENEALLGNGNWPKSVTIPKGITMWKSEAVYSSFRVDTIARIKIVHDDGTKIVRRQRRLKALDNASTLYISDDLAVIAQAKRLLGLKPDQIVSIGNIPDVYVAPRGTGTPRPKKVVEPTRPWCIGLRNMRTAGVHVWNANNDRILGANAEFGNWINALVKGLHAEGLLSITELEHERAVKAGKISENYRLDKVVAREVAHWAKDVRYHVHFQEAVSGIHQRFVSKAMRSKVGLTTDPTVSQWQVDAFARFHRAEYDKMVAEGRAIRAELAVKYPLLFGYDDSAVATYVKAMDELWA